jgi:excisionase family DNA binding protein
MATASPTTDQLRLAAIESRLSELEALIREGVIPPATRKPRLEADRLYSAREVAEVLRCGKTNVYDLIDSGQIAVTRIGSGKKGIRVRGEDVTAFLDDRREGGPAPKTKFKFLKSLN